MGQDDAVATEAEAGTPLHMYGQGSAAVPSQAELKESGSRGDNSMLSNERWAELDWDKDGTIDLAEFINAFTHWVDTDNVLEFDDE